MPSPITPQTVHRLKFAIKGLKPPVWRRVLVPSGITLDSLHLIIQRLFGWDNCHLHDFTIGGVRYANEDVEGWGEPLLSEYSAVLGDVAPKGTKFLYCYDFGDDWEHSIVVEDVVPADPKVTYPVCTAGKRSGPLEDVGGPWGYLDFLEAIADPGHEEHEQVLEWAGEAFDAERCDLGQINAALARIGGVSARGKNPTD